MTVMTITIDCDCHVHLRLISSCDSSPSTRKALPPRIAIPTAAALQEAVKMSNTELLLYLASPCERVFPFSLLVRSRWFLGSGPSRPNQQQLSPSPVSWLQSYDAQRRVRCVNAAVGGVEYSTEACCRSCHSRTGVSYCILTSRCN